MRERGGVGCDGADGGVGCVPELRRREAHKPHSTSHTAITGRSVSFALHTLCGVYKFDKLVAGMHTQFSIGILLMKTSGLAWLAI